MRDFPPLVTTFWSPEGEPVGGAPDTRSPLRFLRWVLRQQGNVVVIATMSGVLWQLPLIVGPWIFGWAIDAGVVGEDPGAIAAGAGALLVVTLIGAAFGILLTMLLSVFERRRELALSRAVGMSKRQVRSMVRWEAVITSLLGALQGVIVGSALGFALYWALRSQGFKKFEYPVGTVIVVTVLAALIGVLAAVIPARRATKVNVVEAISTT